MILGQADTSWNNMKKFLVGGGEGRTESVWGGEGREEREKFLVGGGGGGEGKDRGFGGVCVWGEVGRRGRAQLHH